MMLKENCPISTKGFASGRGKVGFTIRWIIRILSVGKVASRLGLFKRFVWDLHHLSRFKLAKVRHGSGGNSIVG